MTSIAQTIISTLQKGAPVKGAPGVGAGHEEYWGPIAVNMVNHVCNPLQSSDWKSDLTRSRQKLKDKVIWASELGKLCDRQLWYKMHTPEQAEMIGGSAKFKFTYGHMLEEMALAYCRASGMSVSHEQFSIVEQLPNGWTVRGRIDAVIEGRIVDVKSCSSFAFKGYKDSQYLDNSNDSWGYVEQLGFYEKNKEQLGTLPAPKLMLDTPFHAHIYPEFLFIDKQNGSMVSRASVSDNITAIWKSTERWAEEMENTRGAPERFYQAEPEGLSGNMKIPTPCSYCDFKKTCWPGLKAYLSSKGPLYLSEVKKTPKIPEIEVPLTRAEWVANESKVQKAAG